MTKIWEDIINGLEVGGRATDLEQIALTILKEVDAFYPHKTPPRYVTRQLAALAEKLKSAETALTDFARFMIEEHKANNGGE